jgi:hypothetical protein
MRIEPESNVTHKHDGTTVQMVRDGKPEIDHPRGRRVSRQRWVCPVCRHAVVLTISVNA